MKLCEGRNPKYEDLNDYLEHNGLEEAGLPTSKFKEMLLEMDIIGNKDENWDYFREEFDYDEDGLISSDKFE